MTTFVPDPTGGTSATLMKNPLVLNTPIQGAPFLMGGGKENPLVPKPPLAKDPGPGGGWLERMKAKMAQPHGAAINAGMGLNPRSGMPGVSRRYSGPFSGPGYYHINGTPMLLPGNDLATGGANNWLGNGANLSPATGATGPVGANQITGWLSQNPGASDGQIAQAMGQYGVSPAQLAAATGADPAAVMSRYAGVGQNILNGPGYSNAFGGPVGQ